MSHSASSDFGFNNETEDIILDDSVSRDNIYNQTDDTQDSNIFTATTNTGMWYRDVAAVPASSAGVEREFSMAGDIVTKKRNRLSGKTISNIMQYKR